MSFSGVQAEPGQKNFRRPTGTVDTAADADPVSSGILKWATCLILVYFALRLVYLALNVSSYVPPDEVTHFGISRVFSGVLLLPDNSPQTYQFGLVTNIPWLYYWTMGKLLHLNVLGLSDLVFLRLCNIPLAFGTVWYAARLLGLLTDNRLTRLLLLVMVTNTAMFTLLSASVSYDNLENLLAAMAIYYLFAFFRDRSAGSLGASFLCQLAGSLTKFTFLPLVLALGGVLVLHEIRNLGGMAAGIKGYFHASPRRAWVGLVALLVATALNLQLYGGNYLTYRTLAPQLSVVVSPEAAANYRMDQRGTIFRDFRDGKISYMDAVIKAGGIEHPGDKADTFYLLMNWQKMKSNPQLWLGPFAYSWLWFKLMASTVIGIKGHLSILKPFSYLVPVYLVLALALVGFILRWRPRVSGWGAPALAAIALFYSGYFLYAVNYDAYLTYGEPGITLYGRYLFPVLVPIYVLTCHYLVQASRNAGLRTAFAVATALLLVVYDFPWFLGHATPEWFSWLPR